MRTRRVVVLGDVMLDRDIEGQVDRVSPDAPVPVVDVTAVHESPGGAGLAASLCTAPDVAVTLVAPLAEDGPGGRLARLLSRDVRLLPLPQQGSTRCKTRVRSTGQSLLRLDTGGPGTPCRPPVTEIQAVLAGADAVLVADYGGGVTRDPTLRCLIGQAANRVPVVWDPHPRGGSPVPGAALVTPNLAEAIQAMHGAGTDGAVAPDWRGHPDLLAGTLRERWQARGVCVTASRTGAWLALAGSEPIFVPTTGVPGDSCGAGDRFAAAAVLDLARGAVLSEAVVDAVRLSSAWVAAGGAAEYRKLSTVDDKAIAHPESTVEDVVARVRSAGGTLVATGGCFDVLHAGHVGYLEAARKLGDALVVLINSDASVRRRKGPDRPVVGAADRARVLRGLASVDAVGVFDEDDPCAALDRLRPDIWAKGGDYGGVDLPEAELVRGWGGRVILLPYLNGRSSTAILQHQTTSTGQERQR